MGESHVTPSSRPRVLLVDDNPDDVFIFQVALRRFQLDWDLHTVDGTDAAIRYLIPNNHPLPDLVITGILLRQRSGHELIAWARSQSHLKHIPIVALSDTPDPRDRQKALDLGATHFVEKTNSFKDVVFAIRQVLYNHYRKT